MFKPLPLILSLVLALSCDSKDEFDKVAPVEAPEAKGPAAPIEEADDSKIPEGHPPIGDAPVQQPPQMVEYASPAEYGKVGPLRWNAPSAWTAAKPASQMRLAEYVLPSETGEPPTLTVFYFGPAGGGGVDANVGRWLGQFGEAGKAAKRGEETVNGMKIHTVDVTGTYNAGMAGGNQPPKPDQRMLGAIVESDAGLFFFKLVGPKPAVNAAEADWKSFVGSFQKG